MMIEFDLPEGMEPPGQGVIITNPGEEPRVERIKGKINVQTSLESPSPTGSSEGTPEKPN